MSPAPERPDHFALVKGTSFVCAADGEDWPCRAVTPAPERPDQSWLDGYTAGLAALRNTGFLIGVLIGVAFLIGLLVGWNIR